MITITHTRLRFSLKYTVFSRRAVAVLPICGLIAFSLSTASPAAQLEPQNMLAKEEHVAECAVLDSGNTRHLVNNKLQEDPIEVKLSLNGDRVFFVSADIYKGWRTYQTFCRACHAINASGQEKESPLPIGAEERAPSLREAVWCKENFQNRIIFGGGGMPSWRNNLLVSTRLDQIHLYVAVVTMGKLPPPEVGDRMLRVKPAPAKSGH